MLACHWKSCDYTVGSLGEQPQEKVKDTVTREHMVLHATDKPQSSLPTKVVFAMGVSVFIFQPTFILFTIIVVG